MVQEAIKRRKIMTCRLCLKKLSKYNCIPLFEMVENNGDSEMVKLITKYLNIDITRRDALSTEICKECNLHLEDFHSFYINIEHQQGTLKNEEYEILLKSEPEEITPVEIGVSTFQTREDFEMRCDAEKGMGQSFNKGDGYEDERDEAPRVTLSGMSDIQRLTSSDSFGFIESYDVDKHSHSSTGFDSKCLNCDSNRRQDIRLFLQTTLEGRLILMYYEKHNDLNESLRNQLSQLLINRELCYILDRQKITIANPLRKLEISSSLLQQLAQEVESTFNEKSTIFFSKGYTVNRQRVASTGKLISRLNYMRTYLQDVGAFVPKKNNNP